METSVAAAAAPNSQPPNPNPPDDTGIYVYSIIECAEPRTFGKIGIGGRGDDVYMVHYKDLAAVVSRTPLVVYDPTRENVLAHEHVNEVIIEEGFTPVPMSFGTLFKTEKDNFSKRVSLVGIDLITAEARAVVASIATYLRYAEAMGITAPVARPPAWP